MKQKHTLLSLLFSLTCSFLLAQSSVFTGTTWKGEIRDLTDDANLIWKAKIKVTSATSAELLLYDDKKGAYVSYLTDSRFAGQKRKVSFIASGKTAALVLSYESAAINGQSVYNMYYDENIQMANVIWSNVNSDMSENSKVLGYGDFSSENSNVYSGTRLKVGGQSFNYISISKIALTDQQTSVTMLINNVDGTTDINGTFHEPGNPIAFYITNADRSVKYKLRSADKSLPHTVTVKPGESFSITLNFDPIPKSMKLLNIFEGGNAEQLELWKFFDVILKD